MSFKLIFSAFIAILMLAFATQSNAQTGCVGVHVSQWWNCENGSAFATAYPVGGTAPYTYNWSNGTTNQTVTDLAPGQYYVTVTDADSCLHVEACIVIHPECCIWSDWNVTPDNCQLGGQGTITINQIGGGVPPYQVTLPNGMIKVTNGSTPIIISGLEAGDYFIPVADSKGCTLEEYINVTTTNGPTATINLATINCGQTNTTANVSVTGGTLPYTYLWDNGTTMATANLNAGTHTVTVTDKNGCIAIATTIVNLPQPPVVTLATTNTTCGEENGAITANITGGAPPYTCLWSSGETTDDLSDVAPGGYTLTVTGANGCTVVGFATILPSVGAQDTTVCQVSCDSVSIYGVTYYQSAENSFIENINGCPRTVSIHAIVLTTGATITQNIPACYGTTVNIQGIDYTDDAIVTTTGTGTCPGQVVWNIEFSEKPDTFPVAPITVCGFVDTSFTFPVSYLDNGCVDHVLVHSVQVQKVQQEIAWAGPVEQCGLVAKVDTLYKGTQFNSATCVLTTTMQELVTNPIQQEIIWGSNDTICSTTASTREILDGITVVSDSCIQFVSKHLLVTVPFATDTILGPVQQICSNISSTFFAYDGEVVSGCDRTLTIHPVETTEWQTISVYGPEVHFCGDTSITLINFDGRKLGANCTDTTFLHKVVIGLSTQDTTWNNPVVTCGFVTGTSVLTDSVQEIGCHKQFFVHQYVVNPMLTQTFINPTTYKCGLIANTESVPDSTVLDTINCLYKVYSHTVVTYPIAASSQQASFCAKSEYLWMRNGKVYNQAGVYADTTTTVDGCPDIAMLFLTELPLAYGDTTVFVCSNGMYQYEGNMYGPGTEEEFYYTSSIGCDSTFVLKVLESQNPITINFPGNVALNLPTMSQQVIDDLVALTATGDTISLLGGTVTENLVKVNDSLWVQTWVILTPCDTIERTRTIMVRQPFNPCDVIVKQILNTNTMRFVVSDKGDPQDIRYEVFSSTGSYVGSGNLQVGQQDVDFSHLTAGGYFIHIYGNVMVNGERIPQMLHDAQGKYSWCMAITK